MGAIVELKIAGLTVPGGHYGDHEFRRPMGVNAPEMVWCLPPKIADAVLKLEWTEVSILAQGSAKPKVFKKVKVVREQQSDHPLKRYVVLSDARWPIARRYVKENYNLRVPSAATELLDVAGAPTEVDPVRTIITYAASSLKNGTVPFTADEILDDVLRRVLKVNFKRLSRTLGNYAPNDVQLDGPGNISLMHALAAAGGVDLRVNDDGDFEIVDAFMGAEKSDVERWIPYSLRDMGFVRWVSMSNVAPVDVQVGFDAEMEVRGDGYLPPANAHAVRTGTPWPTLDNVIQVTDKFLTAKDTVTGKTSKVILGSYIQVDDWAASVATDVTVPPPPVPAQVSWARSYFSKDYMRGLLEFWYVTGQTGGLEPSAAWANRYRAMREHYLKTWRLNPDFAKLCLPGTIRAVRATLLDPANQTRQPSSVCMDYCRRPSIRGVRDDKNFGWNIHCIPGTPTTQKVTTKAYSDQAFPDQVLKLEDCKQAPVEVRCVDPVAGIFRFGFKKDIHDHAQELVPALVQELPTNNLDKVNRGAGIAYWEQAQLLESQRVVMVFTAVPAQAPLYFVTVSALDALIKLAVNGKVPNPNAKGPRFQLRTGPALQTARIAYSDNDRVAIQAVFYSTDRNNAQNILQAFEPVNLAVLKDYAQASAAALYATLLDHYEGEATVGFTPDAMPSGSLRQVAHRVTSSGRCYTRLECSMAAPAAQPIHFMERGARAVVFRTPGNFA